MSWLRRGVAFGAALALSVTLAACAGTNPTATSGTATVLHAGRVDMNAMAPSDLRDGGELRWPLDFIPDSFNNYQANGTSPETDAVINALMPRAFRATADGKLLLDNDYLVSATMTQSFPQTITYVIQPAATWSDGTPITWRDFEAQWKVLSGNNPAFQAVNTVGYDEIASVTRGADDKQAVVTFKDNFGEWQGLFNPLYPASTNSNPAVFNSGWLRQVPTSAGPFKFQEVNPTANTVTLVRDDAWWGPRAKLDRIIYKVYDPVKLPDGLATNDIDFYPIDASVDLARRARATPGVVIRQSVERSYEELIFNGGPGSPLADLQLRQAIAEGIDRNALARRVMGEIAPGLRQQGNHLYSYGSANYRDNSDVLPYNAAKAEQDLDALGWVRQGDRRGKGGTPLQVRLVVEAGDPIGEGIVAELGEQMFRIGVTLVPQPVPAAQQDLALQQGNFDLIEEETSVSNTPLRTALPSYYQPVGTDVAQNYGRIYNEQIVEDLGTGIEEQNDIQRATIGDGVDQLIWTVVHSLPLFPSPGAYAVRDTLANFGAPGLSDINYAAIGYVE
jgi:peptide/nickel transport system substrate-binding protein